MRYDLARELPVKGQRSACPCCYSELLAKCGRINIHHWAHLSGFDCDEWYEPMSQWHLGWQSLVEPSCREVVMGEHRADIRLADGHVFELQYSSISAEDIEVREAYYPQLTWIFDASDFEERLFQKDKISKYGNAYVTFYWSHPRHSILSCTSLPLYFDCGKYVLKVNQFNSYERDGQWGEYTAWGGWGYRYPKDASLFLELFGVHYVPPTPA